MNTVKLNNIIVAGIGTGVGKTVVSAILTTILDADYWKPIQCGADDHSDTLTIQKLSRAEKLHIHESAYSLKAPLSPHHAARLENIVIDSKKIILPQTKKPLVIEGVGGIFVPLTSKVLSLDLFKTWNCQWVVVSRHYVGSINHTLMTIEVLKMHGISILGLIFNGDPNPDSEEAILKNCSLPILGRLFPEQNIDSKTIKKYAQQWQMRFNQLH